MTDLQKAERVLSSLGRPVGHAAGLYREHLSKLAAFCDDQGSVRPGARTTWLGIHQQVMDENKGADDDTDVILDTDQE